MMVADSHFPDRRVVLPCPGNAGPGNSVAWRRDAQRTPRRLCVRGHPRATDAVDDLSHVRGDAVGRDGHRRGAASDLSDDTESRIGSPRTSRGKRPAVRSTGTWRGQAATRGDPRGRFVGPSGETFGRTRSKRRCVLVVEAEASVRDVSLRSDPTAVEQILFNLVDNACKYAAGSADNRIHVRAELAKSKLTLSVVDHGPGIATNEREQLFRPFFQIGAGRRQFGPRRRTGVGVVPPNGRRLGWHWSVENTASQGAVFALSLPGKCLAELDVWVAKRAVGVRRRGKTAASLGESRYWVLVAPSGVFSRGTPFATRRQPIPFVPTVDPAVDWASSVDLAHVFQLLCQVFCLDRLEYP